MLGFKCFFNSDRLSKMQRMVLVYDIALAQKNHLPVAFRSIKSSEKLTYPLSSLQGIRQVAMVFPISFF